MLYSKFHLCNVTNVRVLGLLFNVTNIAILQLVTVTVTLPHKLSSSVALTLPLAIDGSIFFEQRYYCHNHNIIKTICFKIHSGTQH